MKRKWLSAVLVGAMLATSVPALAADENTGETSLPFTDVSAGDWFYEPVTYAFNEGLMTGTSATEFAPNTTMTRAMIVSVLYRLEGNPEMSDGNLGYPFEDVEGDAWYAMPVYWARENGIMAGYSDSSFGPNDAITREQLAATLYKYAAYKGEDVSARADLSGYSDAAQISEWAKDVMSWANAEGYVNGMTATTIDPQSGATRAQVAAIFQRYLEDDTAPVDPEGETVQLVIGKPDNLQTVEASVDEVTPDAVIAALAEETGWNLDLAAPVRLDEDGVATVAFAADSGVYGQPPEEQKDAYHVYDVEDWIYTVFNSVAESLQANGVNYVCFTAPDGGKLVIDNGDVHFYLMPNFRWDYETAYVTNHHAEDGFGLVNLAPRDESILGVNMLCMYVYKEAVHIEGGSLTIYDSEGNVYETIDMSDEDHVFLDEAQAESQFNEMSMWGNAEALSVVSIVVDKPFNETGEYSIHLDAGALSNSEGNLIREITPEDWRFTVLPFGVMMEENLPEVLQVGESYTFYAIIDGDNADRIELDWNEDYITCDKETLTESGSFTITATAATGQEAVSLIDYLYYKGDTQVGSSGFSSVIE